MRLSRQQRGPFLSQGLPSCSPRVINGKPTKMIKVLRGGNYSLRAGTHSRHTISEYRRKQEAIQKWASEKRSEVAGRPERIE